MSKNYTQIQAEFFDDRPPLSPWPKILVQHGLELQFRPKEIFLKKVLDSLRIKLTAKVLEVGCGQGVFLARLIKSYQCQGVGVDVSAKSIAYAKKNWQNQRLKFCLGDGVKLKFKNNYFNQVMSFDALEHIEDQGAAIKEMVRVLKPGGRLLIYTLNKNDKFTLDWLWLKLGFNVYGQAKHQPELFIRADWVRESLIKLGMKAVEVKYYDAWFTLAAEEMIMVAALGLKKIGWGENQRFGWIFLQLMQVITKISYSILFWLDQPWFKQGRSVGLCIIGQKIN